MEPTSLAWDDVFHVTPVYVLVCTPFTATDRFAVTATSMFRCAGFDADAS